MIDLGPQRGPSSLRKIVAEQRQAAKAMGREACQACGDLLPERFYNRDMQPTQKTHPNGKLDYCEECAKELFFGIIDTTPAQTYAGRDVQPDFHEITRNF